MGKKAATDHINFNYPIPRSVHYKAKTLSLRAGMPMKDIVVNALIMYIDNMTKFLDQEEMAEKALQEPHGTNPFDEDDL